MSERKSFPTASRIIAGVSTAAIVGAASFLPGVWNWISERAHATWIHLTDASPVPHWALYLAVLALTPTAWFVLRSIFGKSEPDYTSYTEDTFFNLKWRWRFDGVAPLRPWAFCPRCDTVLVYEYQYEGPERTTILHCETCNLNLLKQAGDKDDLVAKVARQIDRKVRTGEWNTRIANTPHGAAN